MDGWTDGWSMDARTARPSTIRPSIRPSIRNSEERERERARERERERRRVDWPCVLPVFLARERRSFFWARERRSTLGLRGQGQRHVSGKPARSPRLAKGGPAPRQRNPCARPAPCPGWTSADSSHCNRHPFHRREGRSDKLLEFSCSQSAVHGRVAMPLATGLSG